MGINFILNRRLFISRKVGKSEKYLLLNAIPDLFFLISV